MSIKSYKIKWNYYNRKLTSYDKYLWVKIHKEIAVNENRYLILKYKNISNQIKHRCKKWDGLKWHTFAVAKTPRQALNKIYKMEHFSEEQISLK